MKLVEMKCTNCGAKLKVNPDSSDVTCKYCRANFKFDDGVKKVKFDDMEQSGYEFEKGRLRAQKEMEAINEEEIVVPKKSKITIWKILLWLFFLPFMLIYFLITTDKLTKKQKIIIGIILFIIVLLSPSEEEEARLEKQNKIVMCYSQEVYDKLDELIQIDNIDGYFSETTACDSLKLKNKQYKYIDVEMEGQKLISISLDKKYIYHIDETVEIYDSITLRVKEKISTPTK